MTDQLRRSNLIVLAILLALLPRSVVAGTVQPICNVAAVGVSLQIDFGNGTVSTYQSLDGTDVLNVTMKVALVEVTWYGSMAFVRSIADVENNPSAGKWWQYWVNGNLGGVAANLYSLVDSDTVVWKLTGSAFGTSEPASLQTLGVLIALSTVVIAAICPTKRLLERRRTKTS